MAWKYISTLRIEVKYKEYIKGILCNKSFDVDSLYQILHSRPYISYVMCEELLEEIYLSACFYLLFITNLLVYDAITATLSSCIIDINLNYSLVLYRLDY